MNYLRLICSLLLTATSLAAQGWEQTYSVPSPIVKQILPHPTNGYFHLGSEHFTHIDNEGDVLWHRSTGGQYMIETSDGEILIAARESASIQVYKYLPDGTITNNTITNNQLGSYIPKQCRTQRG